MRKKTEARKRGTNKQRKNEHEKEDRMDKKRKK